VRSLERDLGIAALNRLGNACVAGRTPSSRRFQEHGRPGRVAALDDPRWTAAAAAS